MDKVIKMTLLFDYYGPLLTEKQQKFIDLYYGNDYSLGEIANNYGVSRQAVHDALKKAEVVLVKYENKLGLIKKALVQHDKLAEIDRLLAEAGESAPQQLSQARKLLQELLEDRG